MKNTYLLIITLLAFAFTSCSILKGNKGHNPEEAMKANAYAMANTQCEYQLLQIEYVKNKSDLKLKIKLENKRSDVTTLKEKFFNYYSETPALYKEFQKMTRSVSVDLSTCQKIIAIEDARKEAEENAKKDNGEKK